MIELKNGDQIFEYKFEGFISDSNSFGNKPEDYEVLQVLGEGGFGQVLKVKTKNGLGIYAMKKVNMEKVIQEQQTEKYFENEVIILQNLNHPNVCRCYNVFKDNNFLYFIMELMNNGDLKSYYGANKLLKLHIPEEKLWDIFYKCLMGLEYIHKKGLIHRDIKLENLFLDDKLNIKIGDFNVSVAENRKIAQNFTKEKGKIDDLLNEKTEVGSHGYMAPEINTGNYDKRVDVYSMGISFFQLMYWRNPYEPGVNRLNLYGQKIYSNEMNEFVEKMIQKNVGQRTSSSNEAFITAKKYFIKKFVKNTSINSVMHCLNNFPNFREYFSNPNYVLFLTDNKREISNAVYNVIKSLNDNYYNNKVKIDEDMYELRKTVVNAGLDFKKENEEIDPGIFLSFLINKLNSDLNEIATIQNTEDIQQYMVLSSSFLFQDFESEPAFQKLLYYYNKRILSFISRNFFSVIKTKRVCLNMGCGIPNCYFSMHYFIPFNVDILSQKLKTNNNLSFQKAIECLLDDSITLSEEKNIKCYNCNKITAHKESKKFYHTAKNLMIIFDRGENFEHKQFINFDEQLFLSGKEVERYNAVNYTLMGIISKIDNEYVSFILSENNKWTSNRGIDNGTVFSFNDVKQKGIVVSLFYYCFDNKITLHSKSVEESYEKDNNLLNQSQKLKINNNIQNNINSTNNNLNKMEISQPVNIQNQPMMNLQNNINDTNQEMNNMNINNNIYNMNIQMNNMNNMNVGNMQTNNMNTQLNNMNNMNMGNMPLNNINMNVRNNQMNMNVGNNRMNIMNMNNNLYDTNMTNIYNVNNTNIPQMNNFQNTNMFIQNNMMGNQNQFNNGQIFLNNGRGNF